MFDSDIPLPPNTLLLTSRVWSLYFVHDCPHLIPEVEEWCNQHIKKWIAKYLFIRVNDLQNRLASNVPLKNEMRSLPVIQFEDSADMIMFKLRWF